ncbi:hypothetical protein LXL04_020640 [Taraxacum kok-saghyz]
MAPSSRFPLRIYPPAIDSSSMAVEKSETKSETKSPRFISKSFIAIEAVSVHAFLLQFAELELQVNPCYTAFHDEEWGVPVHDDKKLFELLSLSTTLAELTWTTILQKRHLFRNGPCVVAKLQKWSPCPYILHETDKSKEMTWKKVTKGTVVFDLRSSTSNPSTDPDIRSCNNIGDKNQLNGCFLSMF